MIVLFIRARLEHVAGFSLPKGYTYTVTVTPLLALDAQALTWALHGLLERY